MRPLYTFSQPTDMKAFQSALRGSFLQRTLDVETIKAKTMELASSTHLKLWTDDDGIHSFTFYGNKLDPMQFLEFEISVSRHSGEKISNLDCYKLRHLSS